jgi:hypothetical protein
MTCMYATERVWCSSHPMLTPVSSLADVPPQGLKMDAYCWTEQDGLWDGQCTMDCVAVTAMNGSKIYPAASLGTTSQLDDNQN